MSDITKNAKETYVVYHKEYKRELCIIWSLMRSSFDIHQATYQKGNAKESYIVYHQECKRELCIVWSLLRSSFDMLQATYQKRNAKENYVVCHKECKRDLCMISETLCMILGLPVSGGEAIYRTRVRQIIRQICETMYRIDSSL